MEQIISYSVSTSSFISKGSVLQSLTVNRNANEKNEKDKVKALIFIHHHLHESYDWKLCNFNIYKSNILWLCRLNWGKGMITQKLWYSLRHSIIDSIWSYKTSRQCSTTIRPCLTQCLMMRLNYKCTISYQVIKW